MALNGSQDTTLQKNEERHFSSMPDTAIDNEKLDSSNSDASPTDVNPGPAVPPPSNPPPNGGMKAWLQVLGSWMLIFNTWGT